MGNREDELQDFIEHNKEAFDSETPGDGVWENVSNALPAAKVFNWWMAASIVFFMTSGALTFHVVSMNANENKNNRNLALELEQIEMFYYEQISTKTALILDFEQEKSAKNAFQMEIQRLDAMYLVLKEAFDKKPSEKVLEAMTLNLVVRMNILNQVLSDIEDQDAESPGIAI